MIAEENYNVIPALEPFKSPSDPGTFSLQVSTTTIMQSPTATVHRSTGSTTRTNTPADIVTTKSTQTAIISSAEVTTQKAAHDKAVKHYCECQAAEQALQT